MHDDCIRRRRSPACLPHGRKARHPARVVIPLHPGVGSAVGMLRAPVAFEVVRSRYMTLATFDAAVVAGIYSALAEEASTIVRQGAGDVPLEERRTCFMRYLGQGHEIEVPVSGGTIDNGERKVLQAAYDREYARQYSRSVPGMDVEILGWKLVVAAPLPDNPKTVMTPTRRRRGRLVTAPTCGPRHRTRWWMCRSSAGSRWPPVPSSRAPASSPKDRPPPWSPRHSTDGSTATQTSSSRQGRQPRHDRRARERFIFRSCGTVSFRLSRNRPRH